MNVFREELRLLRGSIVTWMVVLCVLALIYIAIFPTFSSDADVTRKLLSSMPPAFKAAFKLDADTMLSFLGYFAFTFTNLSLAAAIYAMHTGVGVLSREQRSKTTDFLLSKPRSRTSIFLQKFGAGFLGIIFVWAVLVAASYGLAKAFGAGDFSTTRFGLLMLALLVVELWFYACGLFASQIVKRLKSTIPTTLAVVFGFFMVGMVGAILNEPKTRYISPFKFFDFIDIVAGKGYELQYVLVAAISAVLAVVAAYVIYTKRDVKAVA